MHTSVQIVQPAYHQLVIEAATALERSTGVSMVFALTAPIVAGRPGAVMASGRRRFSVAAGVQGGLRTDLDAVKGASSLEIRDSVDQRRQRIAAFIADHQLSLARPGSIVASWRRRGGKQLGPYHKFTCRDQQGRQRSIYLGA
jgi:hypothetical protein